ncbi:MAG: hydroxymethylglutaryl-CoA synthase, partial [Proteobacteria bacterium]
CYTDRTREAYFSFKKRNNIGHCLHESWSNIIMHLPYSFQGRRMLPEIYALDANPALLDATDVDYPAKLKELAKTIEYREFVDQKLRPAELASSLIGNLYTGSIFMGLLSTLCEHLRTGNDITGAEFGFLAYGSGSKSKVFQGEIQPEWRTSIAKVKLFETLATSVEIDFETYERLHRKERHQSVRRAVSEWVLARIETQDPSLIGARYYQWTDAQGNKL